MATHNADVDRGTARISDDDDPSKRSRARVSQACTRCRTRKDRCDGKQPHCSNCLSAGQPCLYVAGSKKRGLPEGYVRGLEKLWAVMLQKVHGLDDTVRRVVDDNEEELLRIWNHDKLGEGLHAAWKDSGVLAELEKLLSRMDQSLSKDLKRKRDKEDDDETTQSFPDTIGDTHALAPNYEVTPISIGNDASTSQVAGTSIFVHAGSSSESILDSLSSQSAALPSSASSLLNHYFTYSHCWFPILDRPYTLKKFYEYTRSQKRVQPQSADLAYLWAICAYSQQQMGRSTSSHPSVSNHTVAEMRAMARKMIPPETGPFELGHIQAILLLVLLDMGQGEWTSSWILAGFAVRALLDQIDHSKDLERGRMAFQSVGNNHTNGSTLDFHLSGIQHKRLMALVQGSFILDTIISIRLKRPPHLHSVYLRDARLLDEDGHEEWEPWSAAERNLAESREPAFVISCFNRLTELCMITNDAFNSALSQAIPELPLAPVFTAELHAIAEKYPFDAMDAERRPPHQMILQAYHLATLAAASSMSDNIREDPRWIFLENLEIFEHSWNASNGSGIPSILTAMCHVVKPGVEKVSTFLEGQALYFERFNQVQSKLAMIWPGFKPFGTPDSASLPLGEAISLSTQSSRINASTDLSFPAPQTAFWPDQSDQMVFEDAGMIRRDPRMFQFEPVPEYAAGPVEQSERIDSTSLDYGAMSIDIPETGGLASIGSELVGKRVAGIGSATSPSFDGDEIDALFHEMAQLDTTQWTMDRSQGLKDFGFSDDSTFEAFCNDPDRLMLSDGYMGPAFNQGGTSYGDASSALAGQGGGGPRMQAPGARRKMTFDEIFR